VNYFFTAVDKIVELKNRPKKEQANPQKEEINWIKVAQKNGELLLTSR